MKDMIYKDKCELVLLEHNSYNGINYAVISFGIFPFAAIEIPKNHPYYQKSHSMCDINCHGGLVFSGQMSNILELPTDTYWIGWYYGHFGDLVGSDLQFRDVSAGNAYTTTDIVNDCKAVIEQLLEV